MQTWITTKIKLDRDKNEIERFLFKEFTIDSRGNILDETEYNEDLKVACKRIYRYFDDGSVKQYVEYNPFDELIERHTYIGDESSDVEKIIYEYGDTHKIVKEFHFRELGLADSATLYDEVGSVVGYETYILNEAGQIIEQVETNAENVETTKYIKVYDEMERSIEDKKFVDGRLTETILFTYDAIGNVARKVTANNVHGFQVIDDYKYDQFGNMLHNTSFQNDFLVFENKCEYDDRNNLLTEEFFEIDYWEKRITRHEKLIHLVRE
jgi:hypothetical protein